MERKPSADARLLSPRLLSVTISFDKGFDEGSGEGN